MENEVTEFIKTLKHPLKAEIEAVRKIILKTHKDLEENIKWNGPNFHFQGEDRITMRIQPPPHLQLIFHRGAKAQEQPKGKLIQDDSGMLVWKGNDRAVITFKDMKEIKVKETQLKEVIRKWLAASDAGKKLHNNGDN